MQEEIKEYTTNFHNLYEKLAPNYGYETRKDTKELDFNSNNGKLMYAVVDEIISPLLNNITNLQKELEELREDNYAYHQLMKMQNKREYRSKFLKEFQEEFGKNAFPDYDEIYKRYDKLKKENKKLKELCDKYEEEHSTTFEEWKKEIEKYQLELEKADSITQSCIFEGSRSAGKSYRQCLNWLEDYKSRNEKAIEYINNNSLYEEIYDYNIDDEQELQYVSDETATNDLLNILKGVDKE